MLYCEDCRVKRKWNKPSTFPFCTFGSGQCELCNKRKDCYDYPSLFAKPDSQKTFEEKQLDKALQMDYRGRAEEMVITFVSGPRAGAIDHVRTADMKKMVIKNGNEVDWYATYELRLRLQEGYKKQGR